MSEAVTEIVTEIVSANSGNEQAVTQIVNTAKKEVNGTMKLRSEEKHNRQRL